MKNKYIIQLLLFLIIVNVANAQLVIDRVNGSPFPYSSVPDKLYLTSENYSYAEKISLQTLMGIIAKTKPEILRDTYGHKQIVEKAGIPLDNTYYTNYPGLLAHFAARLSGYILCNSKDKSTNVAISLSGILNAVAIPAEIEQSAINAGLTKLLDVRGKDEAWALANYGNQFSKQIASYQQSSDDRGAMLGDYSTFTNAFQFWDNTANGPLATSVYNRMNSGATFLGWGPGEYETVEQLSQRSMSILPSDWAPNLSALTNIPAPEIKQKEPYEPYKVVPNVHTVCFVISDGDNVQWLLGSHDNTRHWNNPKNAQLKLGWTTSPSLVDLAPTVYNKYVENMPTTKEGRNVLIAGPSGRSYYFPGIYPNLAQETDLLNRYMKKADLRIVNIIDVDNGPHLPDQYLRQSNIDALFYYSYGAQYIGLNGQISWYRDKPSIGGRFNLWGKTGDPSVNDQVTTTLANKLNAQSTNIYSQDGYSLIPVHIWTMDVNEVMNCINKLAPHVRVVAPDEFVWLIRKNLKGLPVGTGNGLWGEYFQGYNHDELMFSRTDRNIDFDWKSGSPNATLLGINQFSVRWTGQIQPLYSEEYTFYVRSDDGARLTINGQTLINDYATQGSYTRSGKITLTAGQKYDIRLEYGEGGGLAFCSLEWESASQMRQMVPKGQLYSRPVPSEGIVTAYADCNYNGYYGGIGFGDFTLNDLKLKGINNDDISSIKIAEGYKVILYQDDNFLGQSIELTSNSNCLDAFWNNKVSSIRVRANGVTNLAGTYFLYNRNSGLMMDVVGGEGGTGDNVNIQQYRATAKKNQQFEFTHLGDGVYKIIARHSGKSLDIEKMSMDNFGNVWQRPYYGSDNQQFIVVPASDGYYKLIAKHSGKVVEVANASKNIEANISQYTNNNQICGQWGLVSVTTSEPVIVYTDCPFAGVPVGLTIGEYNLAKLNSLGINTNSISSLQILEGYEIILFDNDDFTGDSIVLTSDISCLKDVNFNDLATSIKVKSKGESNLAGIYYLQNRNSGKFMEVRGGISAMNDGDKIQQWAFTNGQKNQQFQFIHLSNGTYQIVAKHSNKSLDIDGISKEDNAALQQWTYEGGANQQFIVVPTGNGYFKLIAKHSGKVIEIAGGNTVDGASVQQFANNGQIWGQWKFLPVISGNGNGLTGNYFNGMNFETPVYSRIDSTINFNWGNGTPDTSVTVDNFSVRWTGQIQPKFTDNYTFYINSDNGRRLWINGQLVIDQFIDDWGVEYSGSISLEAGKKYDIVLEYFENFGGADCKLEWVSSLQTREVVPKSHLYANPLPVISITSPTAASSFVAPATITVIASATDDGSIAQVQFFNGTTLLETDNTAPFEYQWENLIEGNYTITAIAKDNIGGVSISNPVSISVNENQLPIVSITSPVNNATFDEPANITIEATATDADGSIEQVEFFNGNTSLGVDNTSPYSFSWNNVAEGVYTIKVVATDNSGAIATDVIIVTVNHINELPEVTLTSPANNIVLYVPASVELTADASDTDGEITKVDYFHGNTLLGSATTPPYSFNWSDVSPGTYIITAIATDNEGATTTSSPVSISVIDLTTSIQVGVNTFFTIAPNPVINEIILLSNNDLSGGKIEIINALGEIVLIQNYNYGPVSLASLPSGHYRLIFSKNEVKEIHHFIK